MRMTRVNLTLPDDLLREARATGLNLSACAAAGLREELDRRSKIAEMERYLAEQEAEREVLGQEAVQAAQAWADDVGLASRGARGAVT